MSTLVPTEVSTAVPPTSMSGTSCSGSTPGHHTLASSHSLVSTTISGYNSVPGTSVSGSVNSLINPVIKTEIEDDIDMPEYQDMQGYYNTGWFNLEMRGSAVFWSCQETISKVDFKYITFLYRRQNIHLVPKLFDNHRVRCMSGWSFLPPLYAT